MPTMLEWTCCGCRKREDVDQSKHHSPAGWLSIGLEMNDLKPAAPAVVLSAHVCSVACAKTWLANASRDGDDVDAMVGFLAERRA